MVDPHSGQDKDTYSAELALLAQKYFLDGQLIWVANIGYEATYAQRAEIPGLPAGFDWPTEPEMEIEAIAGTGLSYRFMRNCYLVAVGILTLSGYALYYTGNELLRDGLRLSHLWLGLVSPALLIWHIRSGRRT